MKIVYLSASTLPSYDANSVNVINMCSSFCENGHEVTLVGNKGIINGVNNSLEEYYNLNNLSKINFILVKKNSFSILTRILKSIVPAIKSDIVYTRWIVGAFVFSVLLRKNTVLEVHSLSSQKLKGGILVDLILKSSKTKRVIFITNALKKKYISEFGEYFEFKSIVLPGAAEKKDTKREITKSINCGYIGSFKEGKGIDILIGVAKRMSDMLFHVVGGTKNEIDKIIKENPTLKNIIWYGNLPFKEAQEKAKLFEIALLPNQKNVMINNDNIGDVTSPNKLFEYMANGKAIISSDLPVLKEILIHGENSILVESTNIEEWVFAINNLVENNELRIKIQEKALLEISNKYNWNRRSQKSLEGIKNET